MFETKELLLQALIKCVPYPDQMNEFDLSKDSEIRFNWRGNRFSVSLSGRADEVGEGILAGSNLSILLSQLIKQYKANLF